MEPLKMGIISVAKHFTRRVAAPVGRIPEVRFTAIASRQEQRAKEAALQWNIDTAYGSYEELLKDSEVEAVYIPLPNHLHLEWIRKAADAGKHILCEKPLTMSAAESQEAVDYAAKKGVLLMEAFMYRFHPQWRRVKELILTDEIGPVQSIHTVFAFNNSDPKNIRNRLETGGGAIPDIGSYAVSSARWIMGSEPKRVVSLVKRDEEFRTDSLSSAILDFGTARAVFTVATRMFPAQSVEVFGGGGKIRVELPFNMHSDVPAEITVDTTVGRRVIRTEATDQYGLQFAAFARAVREGGPVPTPPEDAVLNQKVLDALFRSERSGDWENV